MLTTSAERAVKVFRALVIANEGEHFCVGANLLLVVMAAGAPGGEKIRTRVRGYQNATQRLKYASVPVVAAPYGMTLGGGLELCFACDEVQAAAETYSGLVEVGVGLLPGGAGNMNMLWRALDAVPEGANVNTYEYVTQVFKNVAMAKVATSAEEGKAFGYFRNTDGVSFDRARQLTEAKKRAIGLAGSGLSPPCAARLHAPWGERDRDARHDGRHARRGRLRQRARREDRAQGRERALRRNRWRLPRSDRGRDARARGRRVR